MSLLVILACLASVPFAILGVAALFRLAVPVVGLVVAGVIAPFEYLYRRLKGRR